MNEKIGNIIAYWNVEHTKRDRARHLTAAKDFLEKSGLDRIFDAKDVSLPDWDKTPSSLGQPATRIDLVLKKPFAKRVWRSSKDKSRLANLSTVHLVFRKNAGVYDFDRHQNEVKDMTSKNRFSEKEAARISNWKGWDDFVCECTLCSDARHAEYRSRVWTGYDGDPGDSFNYSKDWNATREAAFDAVWRMVRNFGIGA